jgi:uncharacterized membrane protein HdeD (DUF308 family)
MDTSRRKTHRFGLLAILSGLLAGGWLGFTLEGGSCSSFSDALLLTTLFLVLSPLLLFSFFMIMREDFMHRGDMHNFLCICVGLLFIAASWILARQSGRVCFQLGTFLGALIYNTAAGIMVAEGLSA